MRCNADRLIDALIGAQMMELEHRRERDARPAARPPVVTLSRTLGALGREVAQELADALEVRCCDRMILEEVARRAHVDEKLVKVLEEHAGRAGAHWWQSVMGGPVLTPGQYHQHLVRIVLSISRTGGVIVGRGAHMILGPERAFRVRITGSPGRCAARVAEREHLDEDQAARRVREENRERADYLRRFYGVDAGDAAHYDLVLNSDRYSAGQLTGIILYAMHRAGYPLPRDTEHLLSGFS